MTGRIDGQRLVRLAIIALALLGAALVCLAYQPQIDALQERLDDAQGELRSDDVAISEMPRLRIERATLAARYDGLVAHETEATFLRELAATVRRHDVDVVSTTVAQDAPQSEPSPASRSLFETTHVSLELRGRYASLLAAIADLSRGADITRVEIPTIRRDGDALVATVPVTIYELPRGAR